MGLGAVLAVPVLSVHAQVRSLPRVGVLAPSPPPPDAASVTSREALERGLRELGWNPGVDIVLEYRFA